MTQTPKVEKQDNEMVAGWLPSVPLVAPKVEKKSLWIWFNQHPSPRVLKQADFDMGLNPEFKDQCTEVVHADYVSALETALKAAKNYIEILEPYSGYVTFGQDKKEYQDALAKVDL